MKTSLDHACEEFFIMTLRLDPRLRGLTIVHFEEEQRAKTNCITVKAKVGENNLAGPGGFDVEITIEHRSEIGTSKQTNDLIASGIRDKACRLHSVPMTTLQLIRKRAGLAHITIKDEQTGERTNSNSLRHRIVTIPVQADVT